MAVKTSIEINFSNATMLLTQIGSIIPGPTDAVVHEELV